jgi:hypothetical protein
MVASRSYKMITTTTSPLTSSSSPIKPTRRSTSKLKSNHDDDEFELTTLDDVVTHNISDSDSDSDFEIIGSSSRITQKASKPSTRNRKNEKKSIKRSAITEDDSDDLDLKLTCRKSTHKRTKLNSTTLSSSRLPISTCSSRPHDLDYHTPKRLITSLPTLLQWFDSVR